MFAARGVALARGTSMIEALCLGMTAGALNVTRRGLGTGTRVEIERPATHHYWTYARRDRRRAPATHLTPAAASHDS
jgi:hypothetical protein